MRGRARDVIHADLCSLRVSIVWNMDHGDVDVNATSLRRCTVGQRQVVTCVA